MAGTENQWRSMRLLRDVEDSLYPLLMEQSVARSLAAGEVLLSPEQPNRHIYFVVSGQLCVRLHNLVEKPIAAITPGQCSGEVSILDERPPSAWVSASFATELLVLNRDQLWALVERSHALSRNLLYIMSRRIRNYRQLVTQQTDEANTDALTGLHNRRWLDGQLPRAMAVVQQSKKSLALLMIDADHFKQFNDQYGHAAGDQALSRLANVLQESLRTEDSVVRYGGEEFTVLLPNSDEPLALAIAERIRAAVAATALLIDGVEKGRRITVSVGAAVATTEGPLGHDELLRRADKALYQAKSVGRNRVERFTDALG